VEQTASGGRQITVRVGPTRRVGANLDNLTCMCKQVEAILALMDASEAPTVRKPVIRSEPDPAREAVSTAVAATRCQLSRFYVAELVRHGKLDGYGVRRPEGKRIRWYVYVDALPDEPEETDGVRASDYHQELLKNLLDARNHSRLARNERTGAHRLLMDAIDTMTAALSAAEEGEIHRERDLLREVLAIRNDEGRRLLTAQQHETDAEACLDAAVRTLSPPGEEVKSHAKDTVDVASARGSRPRAEVPLAFPGSTAPEGASEHD